MSASTERKNRQATIEAGTNKKLEAQRKRDEKKAKENRTVAICVAVVAVIVIAAILLNVIPAIKNAKELKRYTDGVAVTVGERSYSPAEVGYLYFNEYSNYITNNYYYAMIFGLDTSKGPVGLGSQPYSAFQVEGKEFGTWRDYFLDAVYTRVAQVQGLLKYAAANGIELTQEEKDTVETNVSGYKTYASQYGYANVDQFLSQNIATGLTLDMIRSLELDNSLAAKAYTAFTDSLSFSDEELKEEYASFNGEYDSFDYAVYTVAAESGEDGEINDRARLEADAEADAIIMSYRNGDDVEDLYERLNGYIEEMLGGSASRSEGVTGSYLSGDYSEWLRDASRQPGDITKITGDTGSTVVLFLGRETAEYPTVNVRHILIKAEGGEDGVWSDEALAAAKARAEEILAEYEAGEKTEERFAELAKQYSEDDGSKEDGGLYENVYKGQMVAEFNDWCFADRQAGDTGIVYGTNGGYAGYHVMYYAGQGENYSDKLANDSLLARAVEEFLDANSPAAVPGAEEALVDPVAEAPATAEETPAAAQ